MRKLYIWQKRLNCDTRTNARSDFLSGKSKIATKEDPQVAQDLFDMLMVHKESCVGIAVNMIGVTNCIMTFLDDGG